MEIRKPGNNFQITAVEMVQAWKEIQNRGEGNGGFVDQPRLIPEKAAAACQRCYGTGFEYTDAGVRPGCSHAFGDEDAPLAPPELIDQVKQMRAELVKEPERGPFRLSVVHQKLECDSCGRQVSSRVGWRLGDVCGVLIAEGPELCRGVMKGREK